MDPENEQPENDELSNVEKLALLLAAALAAAYWRGRYANSRLPSEEIEEAIVQFAEIDKPKWIACGRACANFVLSKLKND